MAYIHEHHCSLCYTRECSIGECSVVQCDLCRVSLHQCKLEDHMNNICSKMMIDCPNVSNGCDYKMFRNRVSAHLPVCPASILVCGRDRCRKVINKQCKLDLKRMGKTHQRTAASNGNQFDIQLAIYDQNLIASSYSTSRASRVLQRDPLNPAHPLIPLRQIDSDKTTTGEPDEDSSEDEMREKREKLKKSKLVFANCYMCQIDPSVQHLHTLGNGTELAKMRKRRMTPIEINQFQLNNNLKIDFNVENVPECVKKGENIREIKKGGTMYTIKCMKVVRRQEYGDHCLAQHTLTTDQLDLHVVRCPNWYQGCDFVSKRLEVDGGELRLQSNEHFFTFQPKECCELPEEDEYDTKCTLETAPVWVYEYLCNYLPSSSIYQLSLTNQTIRQKILYASRETALIDITWKKIGPRWVFDKYLWKVSLTEPPCELRWTNASSLSNHLKSCKFYNTTSYEKDERVAVFRNNFKSELNEEFQQTLAHRFAQF